jgi:hypothetical protein
MTHYTKCLNCGWRSDPGPIAVRCGGCGYSSDWRAGALVSFPAEPDAAPTGIESMVCADIAARQQLGIKKYGRTVAESPDDMLRHAYEEALDLAVYLRAEMERRAV